jgi:hypothetical protein
MVFFIFWNYCVTTGSTTVDPESTGASTPDPTGTTGMAP